MIVQTHTVGKTKVLCERCGTNYYNIRFRITHRSGGQQTVVEDPITKVRTYKPHPKSWQKYRTYKGFYSNEAYLCFDCATEAMNELAKSFLATAAKFNYKKVVNSVELKELAAIRHERKIYLAKTKIEKQKTLELKRKENHTGLNVAGEIL